MGEISFRKLLPSPWHRIPGCLEAWGRTPGLNNDGEKLGSCVFRENLLERGCLHCFYLYCDPPTLTVTRALPPPTPDVSWLLLSTAFMVRADEDMAEPTGQPDQAKLSLDLAGDC